MCIRDRRKSAKEIECSFAEKLITDSNTLIDISSNDKYMCHLANEINIPVSYTHLDVYKRQELGQFWAKLNVGNAKLQKTSSNTSITNGNGNYSISGATYGVFSDKDCTKQLEMCIRDRP